MITVQSHSYPDNPLVAESWEDNQESLLSLHKILSVRFGNFTFRFRDAREQIGLSLALGKPARHVCSWLHISLEIGAALFQAACYHGAEESIPIELLGTTLEVRTKKTRYAHPHTWMKAFNIALILRSSSALQSLALHSPSPNSDHYLAPWSDALVLWLVNDESPIELLEVAAGYADEEMEFPRVATEVHKPLIRATKALYKANVEDFNNFLETGLRGHRDILGEDEHGIEAANLLSFEALGLCSLAYDRGIPIEVESGYIPKWIYEGGCKERPDLQAYVKEVSGS